MRESRSPPTDQKRAPHMGPFFASIQGSPAQERLRLEGPQH